MNILPRNLAILLLAGSLLFLILSACNYVKTEVPVHSPSMTPLVTSRPENLPKSISTMSATTISSLSPALSPSPLLTPTSLPERTSILGVTILPRISEKGGLNLVSDAGIEWTRMEIGWDIVEPTRGDRNWARLQGFEEDLLNAVQAGLEPVVILGGTPSWAVKTGFRCGVINEDLLSEFASFASQVVARYSAPPYNIHYWELYNEPDVNGLLGCWGDPLDNQYFGGGAYGRMLIKVYPAIKSVNPSAQVLIGGLLLDCDPINPPDDLSRPGQKKNCTPARFLEGALTSGATDAFDGVAFHSYDYYYGLGGYANSNWASDSKKNGSSTVGKAAYIRSVLEKFHVSNRYLINTEFALFCGREGSNECDPYIAEVETTKAYYAVQFTAQAVADNYKAAIWYATQWSRNVSLFNQDLTPKPAYYAYRFANYMIGNASFSRVVNLDLGMKIYEFKKQSMVIWVTWALEGKTLNLNLPKLPDTFYRILPNGIASSQSVSQTIRLGPEPIFLVFK